MKKFSALIASALLAAPAFAHTGHELAASAMAGLIHPLTGFDHLIALACVGALLAAASLRARRAGLAALLVALTVGGSLGVTGVQLPAAELMIGLSVLLAGVALVFAGDVRPAALIGGVALFAVFHGYAHGVESTGDALAYVFGLLASSASVVLISMVSTAALLRQQALRVTAGVGAGFTGFVMLLMAAS